MHYGIDIGGTKIEIACFNSDFELVDSWRVPTPVDDYKSFLNAIQSLVKEADEKNQSVGSVGIGLPGVLNKDTGLLTTSNIPCASNQPLAKDLSSILDRAVAIENDCRTFAFSEAKGGAAEGYKRVFGAILGTGAGGGLCIDGEIYHGSHRVSGEWGHLSLSASLQQRYELPLFECGCGLKGCYERYIAGPGVARLYRHFGGQERTTPEVIDAFRAGEDVAVKTFYAFIELTAAALSNLVLTCDPDAIVIGGGLSNVPELYSMLPEAMTRYLFSSEIVPEILPPRYGDSSGVRGAAILGSLL